MDRTIEIIKTVLPVIIALSIGMICRRYKILTEDGVQALKKVVINITLPAVMLSAFATMKYTLENVIIAVIMFVVCIAAYVLGGLFGKVFREKSKFIPFITTGFEAGMLGYAFFIMLFGNGRVSEIASVDLGQVLFVFTLYKMLLNTKQGDKVDGKQILKEMFTSPIIIAILAGILIGATGLYSLFESVKISGILNSCTDFIGAPTSAIILLAVGYDLAPEKIVWGKTLKAVFLRLLCLLICRIALGGILNLLGIGTNLSDALNILFILPPPYAISVFVNDEQESAYISSVVSLSTLVSVIGFMFFAIFI